MRASYGVLAVMLAVIAVGLAKRAVGRGPLTRLGAIAVVLFLGVSAPASEIGVARSRALGGRAQRLPAGSPAAAGFLLVQGSPSRSSC